MEKFNKDHQATPTLPTSAIVTIGLILSQLLALTANISDANRITFYCVASVFYPLTFWFFGIQFQPTTSIFNAWHSFKKLVINSLILLGLTILVSKYGVSYNFSDLKIQAGPLFFLFAYNYCILTVICEKLLPTLTIKLLFTLFITLAGLYWLPHFLKPIPILYLFFLLGSKGIKPIFLVKNIPHIKAEMLIGLFLLALIMNHSSSSVVFIIGDGSWWSYFLAIIAAIFIAILLKTSPANLIGHWWIDWVSWISESARKVELKKLLAVTSRRPITAKILSISLAGISIVAVFILSAFINLILFELPLRDWNVKKTFMWYEQSIYFASIGIFLILATYYLLRIFISRGASLALLFIPTLLLAIINQLKINFLNSPLLPNDLYLANQALSSLGFIVGKGMALIIFLLSICAAISIIILFIYHRKSFLNKKKWPMARGIVAALLLTIFMYSPAQLVSSEKMPNIWELSDEIQLYQYTGFFGGLIYNYKNFKVTKPNGFEPGSIARLTTELELTDDLKKAKKDENTKPHVIIIQSEAYWDPGLLSPGLYPDGSPGRLEPICEATLNNAHFCATGYVSVPSFGGITANTEYEVLTGMAISLFPSGAVPFNHFTQKKQPSIAWRFRQAGYKTVGLHPHDGWFWNRNNVYPRLGFQYFYDIEYFADADKNELYVSDDAINRAIEKNIEETNEPLFLFSVSMANHAPFNDDRYEKLLAVNIDWEAVPNLSPEEHKTLATFSIGIRESRRALQELIATYSSPDSPPVIILFYGDHLPILGGDFRIYEETGYKPLGESIHYREMFSTPYLIWSNQELHTTDWPHFISAPLLGQQLASAAGLGRPIVESLLNELQTAPGFRHPPYSILQQGNQLTDPSARQKKLLQLYRHLFFDTILADQQYLHYFGVDTLNSQLQKTSN